MKNILLLIHDDSGQEARLQVALDLCRALGGHVTCVDVSQALPVASSIYEDLLGETIARHATRELAQRDRIEQRLRAEDVPWNWIDATGDIAPRLREASRLADIIVVNRQLEEHALPDMRAIAGDVITRSDKPVLAVPPDCPRLDLARPLVAWDGSRCAAAALRAAVPLLAQAERVVLLEVEDGSITSPAEEAAAYLSRHDIHPAIARMAVAPGGARRVIMQELAGGTFGYVVMGGYGHLRFVEALFGGVTREMLSRSPVPVFFAH